MKSGPTLKGATRCPACRSAPIKPVATVVFPLPDAGAAITTAGTPTVLTAVPFSREQTQKCPTRRLNGHFCVCSRRPSSREGQSPLDALLALTAQVHRVFHLGHLGDQIGGVEQRLRCVAAGDHHVLGARPRRERG